MKQEVIWTIIGALGILVLSILYGYCIGTAAKRRSWSGKKVKRVAALPILGVGIVLIIASILSRNATGYGSVKAWATFPWAVMLTAGYLAMFVAAKIAYPGVPLSQLDRDHP
jgi:hypothetical protein